MNVEENKIVNMKITDIKLKKDSSKYLLDIDLDSKDIKARIENLLLYDADDQLREINIERNDYNVYPYICGLFKSKLKLMGNCYLIQKEKRNDIRRD